MLRRDTNSLFLSHYLPSQKCQLSVLDPLIVYNLPLPRKRILVTNCLKWKAQAVLSVLFLWSHQSNTLQEHPILSICSSTQHQASPLAGKTGLLSLQPHLWLLPRNSTEPLGKELRQTEYKAWDWTVPQPAWERLCAANCSYASVTGHM